MRRTAVTKARKFPLAAKGSFASITAVIAVSLLALTIAFSLGAGQFNDSAKAQLTARELEITTDNTIRLLDKATARSACEGNLEGNYNEIIDLAKSRGIQCDISDLQTPSAGQATGGLSCEIDLGEKGTFTSQRDFSFSKTTGTDPVTAGCTATDVVSGVQEYPFPAAP